MAVFKPTDMLPSLNTYDIDGVSASSPIFFICKIDTSNTKIENYSIRLLNSENEQIFPLDANGKPTSKRKTSVDALEALNIENNGYKNLNTGYNGSYLKIPFIIDRSETGFDVVDVKENQIKKVNDTFIDNSSEADGVEVPISNGNSYKWEITLYQTNGSSEIMYYDMVISQGTVLGSNDTRIQSVPSENILNNYYIQPYNIHGLNSIQDNDNEFSGWNIKVDYACYNITQGNLPWARFNHALSQQLFGTESGEKIVQVCNLSYSTSIHDDLHFNYPLLNGDIIFDDFINDLNDYDDNSIVLVRSGSNSSDNDNFCFYKIKEVSGNNIAEPILSDKAYTFYYVKWNGRNYEYGNAVENVGQRTLIKTYDQSYGHIYPITGEAGFSDNTISKGNSNAYQIYKFGNNYDDLSVNDKIAQMPQGTIPWVWNSLLDDPKNSYGIENYWINKEIYQVNGKGNYYPFDVSYKDVYNKVIKINGTDNIANIKQIEYGGGLWIVSNGEELFKSDNSNDWQLISIPGYLGTINFIKYIGNENSGKWYIATSNGIWNSLNKSAQSWITYSTPQQISYNSLDFNCVDRMLWQGNELIIMSTDSSITSSILGENKNPFFIYNNSMIEQTSIDSYTSIPAGISVHNLYCYNGPSIASFCILNTSNGFYFGSTTSTSYIGLGESIRWDISNDSKNINCNCSIYYSKNGSNIDIIIGSSNGMYFCEGIGAQWTIQLINGTSGANIKRIIHNNALYADTQFIAFGDKDIFYHTTTTWQKSVSITFLSDEYIKDICYTGPNKCIMITNLSCYESTNNGQTWNIIEDLNGISGFTTIGTDEQGKFILGTKNLGLFLYDTDPVIYANKLIQSNPNKLIPANSRNILNYQKVNNTYSNNSDIDYTINYMPSAYNGIYYPEYSEEFYKDDFATKATESDYSYVKITAMWKRTPDANTWGTVSNKIVAVSPSAYGEFAGYNVQIDSGTLSELPQIGQINETPFKFVREKPINLYNYNNNKDNDNQDVFYNNYLINNTGLIFYNISLSESGTGRVYIKPSLGIEEGMKFIELPLPSQSNFDITKVNKDYWFVEYTSKTGSDNYITDKTKYKISSYFKTSDESVFYLYSAPEINISTKSVLDKNNAFDGTERAVYCQATYEQDQYIQWRSFQWLLYKVDNQNNKELLSNSDIIYDGKIEHYFYGLENGDYIIELSVETNSGYFINKEKEITVNVNVQDVEDASTISCQFNCFTKTVDINIDLNWDSDYKEIEAFSIYKKEIWYDENIKVGGEEKIYTPVVLYERNLNLIDSYYQFFDFNINNNTDYLYLIRYIYKDTNNQYKVVEKQFYIPVKWKGWNLYELIQTYDENNELIYNVNPESSWNFYYNLEPSQETQNISKQQQETLSKYSKISQGPKNFISGSLSCLIGDFQMGEDNCYNYFDYSNKKYIYKKQTNGIWQWEENEDLYNYKNIGGYKEKRSLDIRERGNEKLDKLNAWREFCQSGSPKLLRDSMGQNFIVQILENSNQINETWQNKPENISFNWMEIDDAKQSRVYNKKDLGGGGYEKINLLLLVTYNLEDIWIEASSTAKFIYWGDGTVSTPDQEDGYGQYFIHNYSKTGRYNVRIYYDKNSEIILGEYGSVFDDYASPTSIKLNNHVTQIDDSAFYGCHFLTTVTIPDSVTGIGRWAFESCYSLESVTIGNSVTTIGDAAFYNCSSLTSITVLAQTPPSLGPNAFYQVPTNCSIYVPAQSVNAYKTATNWRSRAAYIYAIP